MSEERTIKNVLGELAGYASLCWIERPIGVFDSTEASKAVDKAEAEINKLLLHHHTEAEVSPQDIADVMRGRFGNIDEIAETVHKIYRSYKREE